jgi:hypothetical protein
MLENHKPEDSEKLFRNDNGHLPMWPKRPELVILGLA